MAGSGTCNNPLKWIDTDDDGDDSNQARADDHANDNDPTCPVVQV